MSDKDNSSLYLERDTARTASQRTEFDSLSQLTNALLAGYLEGLYDPWNDLDADDGWGVEPRHTWEQVETYLSRSDTEDAGEAEVNIQERVNDVERRMSRLEHVFETETGIPPTEY